MNEPVLENFLCLFDTDLKKEEAFKMVCCFPNSFEMAIYKSLKFIPN
jgi:hypothetical protein